MVLALVAVVLVGFMAASFLQLSSAVTRRQNQAVDTKRAFYMAEAGLSEAYFGVTIGRTGNVGSSVEPAAFGSGLFWVEATDLGDGQVELESVGMYGGGRAKLSVVVQRTQPDVASLGVFSRDDLFIADGVVLDGFDSEEGPYESSLEAYLAGELGEGDGRVGSNGDVTVVSESDPPTIVHGDVVPGPERLVVQVGEPVITGSVEPAAISLALPPIDVPAVPLEPGLTHASGGGTLLLGPGAVHYGFLNVSPEADVHVQGPATVVLGSLALAPSSSLHLDTSTGRVVLYVEGDVDLQPGSAFSTERPDTRYSALLVSEDADVMLAATGEFHGAIYAPDADVTVGASFEVFGTLVAEHVDLEPGSRVHFDHHLARVEGQEALASLISWRVVDLTPLAGGGGSDPFDLLGVDPDALPPPAAAHEDQMLEITYRDGTGSIVTYVGLESLFDWTLVDEVVDVVRDGEPVSGLFDLVF